MDQLRPEASQRSSGSRHKSARSQDTNASGIADSTISYSQFPQPPDSIPTTPIRPEFGTPSPSRSTFTTPLVPQRRRPLPIPGSPQGRPYKYLPKKGKANASNTSPRSGRSGESAPGAPGSSQQQAHISPYDWHDGASGIGIDVAEDRLLSTSFITSLLQESSGNSTRNRISYGSALSGLSELTYPPQPSTSEANHPLATNTTHRPQGSRPPPSAFMPVRGTPSLLSGDSDTLYSARDHNAPIVRKASVSRALQETSATIHSGPSHRVPLSEADPLRSRGQQVLPQDGEVHPRVLKFPRQNPPTTQTRESMHSTKSAVSSLIHRLSSHHSVQRVLAWRRVKPLPPVPLISPIPAATEIEHRKEDEMNTLPNIVNPKALEDFSDKGYHPHHSLASFYAHNKGKADSPSGDAETTYQGAIETTAFQNSHFSRSLTNSTPSRPKAVNFSINRAFPVPKNRRVFILCGIFFAVCLAAVGTAVGVLIAHKKSAQPLCKGSLVGAACNLNSTCICTSSSPGQCDGIAQNIVDLLPSVNQFFLANYTRNTAYQKIWLAMGAKPCAQQSLSIDVAPALTPEISDNQTQWAQTALLWNLMESQDLAATLSLQNFIRDAPWKTIESNGNTSLFSTTVSGYTFNFATRQVQQPNVSFVTVGQPTTAQLSKIGPTVKSTLDRMYSYASASSTQHQKSLENHWTNVLHQGLDTLPKFLQAFCVSPILLPFDATLSRQSQSVNQLLTPSPSSPFPPPLACYPGLNPNELQQVNAIESGVFGLPASSSESQFDATCFPDRPIYGVLDVLRLRLPFLDSRTGIPRQAAILKREVSPRVIMHNGVILSTLPGPSNVTSITREQSDPRRYGTLGRQYNHVVLEYLLSIPNPDVAIALVEYVLESVSVAAIPPVPSDILYESLALIPTIEVAVFGSISPTDISSAVSSFTTSSGTLFFGSDSGTALRNWVITGCGGSIAWAETPVSPLVVHDSSFSDPTFNQTWTAISTVLKNDIRGVGLINITDTFTKTNRFSPT